MGAIASRPAGPAALALWLALPRAAVGQLVDVAAAIALAERARNGTGVVTTESLSEAKVQQRQVLFGSIIAAASGLTFVAGIAVYLKRTRMVQEALSKDSKYEPLEDASAAREGRDGAAPPPAEAAGLGGDADVGAGLGALSDEEAGGAAQNDDDEEAKAEWAQKQAEKLRVEHAGYLRLRWWIVMGQFSLYVSASVGLPLANAQQATCARGFFWEVHLQFLAVFLANKLTELWLCVVDPTLEWGAMSICHFLLMFLPSFLSFLDGYTDASGVVIAHACADPFAQKLSVLMLLDFVLGVLVVQWVVLLVQAARDPSHACLLKLLHMDLLASVITIPPEQKPLWNRIAFARTFLEDLPQACLQTLYLIFVRKNLVMLLSVLMAIGSSLKALRDARARALASAAAADAFANRERETELYSCSLDGTLRVWDTVSSDCKRVIECGSEVRQIAATAGRLYSSHDDQFVREWSLDTGELLRQFDHGPGRFGRIAVTSSSLYTYKPAAPYTIKEWSLESGTCTREWQGPEHNNGNLGICVAGSKLFAPAPGDTAKVAEWSLESPEPGPPARVFAGHTEHVTTIQATKRRLFSGSNDGTVKEWDLRSGECTRTFPDYITGVPGGLHLARGSLYIVSEQDCKEIRVWSLATGKPIRRLSGHRGYVRSFATLGNKLYSGSGDKTIKEWDLTTGECLRTFQGHRDTVFGLVVQLRD